MTPRGRREGGGAPAAPADGPLRGRHRCGYGTVGRRGGLEGVTVCTVCMYAAGGLLWIRLPLSLFLARVCHGEKGGERRGGAGRERGLPFSPPPHSVQAETGGRPVPCSQVLRSRGADGENPEQREGSGSVWLKTVSSPSNAVRVSPPRFSILPHPSQTRATHRPFTENRSHQRCRFPNLEHPPPTREPQIRSAANPTGRQAAAAARPPALPSARASHQPPSLPLARPSHRIPPLRARHPPATTACRPEGGGVGGARRDPASGHHGADTPPTAPPPSAW